MVCVQGWGARPVESDRVPHPGRRLCDDAQGLLGLVQVQSKLVRNGVVQAVNQQAYTAASVGPVRVYVRLVNQQRRLPDDQQRCEYPMAQTPVHAAVCALVVTDGGGFVIG
jgi:hypothetical protein